VRCCYATILGLGADQVPHFFDGGCEDVEATRQRRWLATKGLGLIQVPYASDSAAPLSAFLQHWGRAIPDNAVILTGATANNSPHSVVVYRGKIAHDPSGAGIVAPIQGHYVISIFTALPALRLGVVGNAHKNETEKKAEIDG
jgi:hypothetical protein